MSEVEQIKQLLAACTVEQRREIFNYLRAEFQIHAIETLFNAKAEVILEAIARSSDLTQRGIRGVIAEAAFDTYIGGQLHGWMKIPVVGDHPYDFLLQDGIGQVRVQVKMQRLKDHRPMTAQQVYRHLPADMYVVETQRTRGGKNVKTHEDTRPYRYGEFDVLAVSMHPSTNDWSSFMYTVADWLIPRLENTNLILKFQPVAPRPDNNWTDDFEICVRRLRSGEKRRIL